MRFFLRPWTGAEPPLSVDWCKASLALAWSFKNVEVFQIVASPPPLLLAFLAFLAFLAILSIFGATMRIG